MKFIGQTSLGFVHGCEYDITSEIRTLYVPKKGTKMQVIYVMEKYPDPRAFKRTCGYTDIETFLSNWDKVEETKGRISICQ